MRVVKNFFERPYLLFVLICTAYVWSFIYFEQTLPSFWHDLGPNEKAENEALYWIEFHSNTLFFPRIEEWLTFNPEISFGFVWFFGQVFHFFKGTPITIKWLHLLTLLSTLLLYIKIGYSLTYKNRLNPLWISIGLFIITLNPYTWVHSLILTPIPFLVLLFLFSSWLFEKEWFYTYALTSAFMLLVEWKAIFFILAHFFGRFYQEHSKLLRFERIFSFLFPFSVFGLLIFKGSNLFLQQFEFIKQESLRPIHTFFYSIILFLIYGSYFVWSWAIRARSRALMKAALCAILSIPLFFFFPFAQQEQFLGLIDWMFFEVVGGYKNIVLCLPWLLGIFVWIQLFFMDVLDRSRWLYFFIFFFFLTQPLMKDAIEMQFYCILPFLCLFSLSEGLVGDEGKLD